jgi:hypothetical protein
MNKQTALTILQGCVALAGLFPLLTLTGGIGWLPYALPLVAAGLAVTWLAGREAIGTWKHRAETD